METGSDEKRRFMGSFKEMIKKMKTGSEEKRRFMSSFKNDNKNIL